MSLNAYSAELPLVYLEKILGERTDLLAESYAPYAAKAYLSADIDSPVTIVRLAGVAGDDAAGDVADAHPGWATANSYGLVLFPSASALTQLFPVM